MLHEFLTLNRQLLITRCSENVAKRFDPAETKAATEHGVPIFLQQLVEILLKEQGEDTPSINSAATQTAADIGRAATLHGMELLHRGFSIDQVVHAYGDVCQCVTALAVEQEVHISTDEFRTLNRCLDDAIAEAVASYGSVRQTSIDRQAETLQQRLAVFSAEHQRLTDIAIHSVAAVRTGNIGIGGATGTLLAHALEELRSLPHRALPEIRLTYASDHALSA